jgi:hypothetical protein
LLPWRYIADGDVRPVATNAVESGRFQGFLLVLTGNMSDQVITVRCGFFFTRATYCIRITKRVVLTASRTIAKFWRYLATLLAGAARGEDEPGDVEIALRLVLAMEGTDCPEAALVREL